jgi:membrane-associated phospholipid phosphatase
MAVEVEPVAEMQASLPLKSRLWRALNFVDRLYFLYLLALSALILAFYYRLPGWPEYLLFHGLAAVTILFLALGARRSRVVNFLHDWYPVLAFIICFEEVASLSLLVVWHWRDAYILAVEARLFPVPPTVWLSQLASRPLTELLEVGYFSYFTYILIVGGALYAWQNQRPFRQVMSASVLSYMLCYIWFILFPTEGPAHTLAAYHTAPLHGGPFHWAVLLIQKYGGVHGNAFPSSHVAAGVVAVIFAWRYIPRLGAWLTPLLLLLCAGAVYDRYHYFSDIVGGLVFGPVAVAMTLAWQRLSGRLD